MGADDNGGRRVPEQEHVTVALFKWVAFLVVSALVLGATAMVLVALWRWIL